MQTYEKLLLAVVVLGTLNALRPAFGAAGEGLPQPSRVQLWLRADVGVELDGRRVVRWKDQSGRGADAVAQAAAAPLWVEQALGGRPALQFDGRRTFLAVAHHPGLNASKGLTLFVVYNHTDGLRLAQKKDRSVGLTKDAWFVTPTGGLGVSGIYHSSTSFVPSLARTHLMSSTLDPSRAEVRIFRNGNQICVLRDVPPLADNSDPLYIGKRNNPAGTEGHLAGHIAELLIYDLALPGAARKQVEEYLLQKYPQAKPKQPTLDITRVVPGHESVGLDWLKPAAAGPAADLRYRIAVRLRPDSWDKAVTVTLPGDRTSGAVSGLRNETDYAVRVKAERVSTGEVVGESVERLVRPGPPPGVVISYLHKDDVTYAEDGQYIGSPSIARLPDRGLVASHDLFGGGSNDLSRIFRSDDNGETWRHISDLRGAFWGKLFAHRGALYMLASSGRLGGLVLHRSADGGATWPETVVVAPGRYHKAPVPVVVHRGRLWTCVEMSRGGWPAGSGAVAASAPVDADLMKPENWTLSAPLLYSTAWLPQGLKVQEKRQGYLEGNAVMDPQGNLLNILRYEIPPHSGKALALSIAADGQSLSFNRIIEFPGGPSKFTILRHPETGVYWTLANRVTEPAHWGMRNVLSLASSPDLDHWAVVRDVLRHDSETAWRDTAFQYVDWLFDGPDILAVSRTAWNGARNYHDANYLTFHRVKDFATPGSVGP